ncbi:hypothetical protein D3C71_2239850 [compost metagenome]
MSHIALDRLHEVGDQVGAALQLYVDARPALAHHLPVGDKAIVDDDGVADDADDQG